MSFPNARWSVLVWALSHFSPVSAIVKYLWQMQAFLYTNDQISAIRNVPQEPSRVTTKVLDSYIIYGTRYQSGSLSLINVGSGVSLPA